MAEIIDVETSPEQTVENVIAAAIQLPGVRIDRDKYLTGALNRHFSPEEIELAIRTSPAAAGISPEKLDPIADASIRYESAKVTAISTVAGIPGGLAMAATIPTDLAQYFAHVLRITQKLVYLYGWDDIFSDEETIDDETKSLLILFIGVMFGAQGAVDAVAHISAKVAEAMAKRIPQQALTKGAIYPIVKKIAIYLGVQMNKEIFGKTVAKVVPVVGGIISGGITLATYAPMCLKLKDHLAGLETADPHTYIIDIEAYDDPEAFEE